MSWFTENIRDPLTKAVAEKVQKETANVPASANPVPVQGGAVSKMIAHPMAPLAIVAAIVIIAFVFFKRG